VRGRRDYFSVSFVYNDRESSVYMQKSEKVIIG